MGPLHFRGVTNPSPKAESSAKAHTHLPHGGMLFVRSSSTDGNKATRPVGLRFSLVCWGPFSYQFRQPGISSPLCTRREGQVGAGGAAGSAGSAGGHRWCDFPPRAAGCPQRCWCAAEQGAGICMCPLHTRCRLFKWQWGEGQVRCIYIDREIFLCLHGLLLAAAVQQPSSPPLSISFPLSWKD